MKVNPLMEPWDLGRIVRLGLALFLLYDGYNLKNGYLGSAEKLQIQEK